MIVKVQISLDTSLPKKQVLVYNEDRSIEWHAEAPKEILEVMDSRPKAFFKAHLDKDKKIVIDEEVPEQTW